MWRLQEYIDVCTINALCGIGGVLRGPYARLSCGSAKRDVLTLYIYVCMRKV